MPTAKSRRARMPLPPEQLVEVIGPAQIALLLGSTLEALGTHPASAPCIEYADVRAFLGEELHAAYDFLSQERQRHAWEGLPAWNLAELVRSRRTNALEPCRRQFFATLGLDDAVVVEDAAIILPGETCPAPCTNQRTVRPLCRTTTAVLAWAILVESALLDERLADDMRETGSAIGLVGGAAAACAGPFYGPRPAPEARAAFNDHVRRRWPLRIFALDPVVQEQNVEEQYAQRREMQVAMALAVASGRFDGQALARYARRLETDLATVALNKTAVGFAHGSDTFGWRFYPRIQAPPTRGHLAALADSLCGTSTHHDLAHRRLEPGMRECTAIVVMPSFVPCITLDVSTTWFSLTHPKAAEQSMRQTLLLSRSVKSMQQTAARCFECNGGYRDGDVARLKREIEKLDRRLPLQTMVTQIPYENTAGGFELFNTGVTDLAPELIGWYGAPGIDPAATTTLFLIGKGFSVHETSVIAGGRPARASLLSRQVLRVEIPPGVQTILPTGAAGGCGCGVARAGFTPRRGPAIRLAGNAEPLPAPVMPAATAPAASAAPHPAEPADRPSLRMPIPAPGMNADLGDDATPGMGPTPGSDTAGCGIDCHAREVVDIHLATPHGVSGHLLIPVAGPAAGSGGSGGLHFVAGNALRLSAAPTKAGTWRVNEYYESAADAIRIRVPDVFSPPARASIAFVLRDAASRATAGTFSIPAPPFDARTQEYVLAGGDLRNFIGDTSRPATDKTLRGALKPYLDSLGVAATADGAQGVERDLVLTGALVTDTKTIPIEGAIPVAVRRHDHATDQGTGQATDQPDP